MIAPTTVSRRRSAAPTHITRRVVACACATVVLAATAACLGGRGPLADLPSSPSHAPTALFVLRSTECDANVSVLQLFDRPAIRRGVRLVGVVLLDGDSAAATVRSQLRAFDVHAPLLRVSRGTRDSLATATRGLGPTIVVRDARGVLTRLLPAPQSPSQLRAVADALTSLAAPDGASSR